MFYEPNYPDYEKFILEHSKTFKGRDWLKPKSSDVDTASPQVTLRRLTLHDSEAFAKLSDTVDDTYNDRLAEKPCSDLDADYWIETVHEDEGCCRGLYRAIIVDGVFVGLVMVAIPNGNHEIDGTIGFMMMPEACGKGIATKAFALMVEEAFRLTSLERLSAVVYEPNKASVRVLEKNGFTLEGRKANAVRSKGIVYDTLLYGLLFKDWIKNNPDLNPELD